MNTKKELLVTSLLAITLAVGLGTLSFSLFSEAPPNVQIDVSAEKNGATSLSFLPTDQVLLEAQVSTNNASVADAPVTFEVEMPNGTDFLLTNNTDSLGTANVTFTIPWPSNIAPESTGELGTWQTKATTKVYGQTLYATTNFTCETLTPTINMYTETGGTFTTNETVQVYIEVRDELNQTVPDQQVSLEALIGEGENEGGNYTVYTTYVNSANASGIATVNMRYPPNTNPADKFEDIATAIYEGMTLVDVITITLQPSG